ncbi:unnamed protein product, partial [Adineta steineri]
MGNYLENFRGNADDDRPREIRRRAGWLPTAGICIGLVLLFLIAITITCSLIPVYLSTKDVNAAVNNVDANLNMLFATDLSTSSGQTVINDGSLTSQ